MPGLAEPSGQPERPGEWLFRVGSFPIHLKSPRARYPELLAEGLGVPLFAPDAFAGDSAATLLVREGARDRRTDGIDPDSVPPDGIVLATDGDEELIVTELLAAALRRDGERTLIELDVVRPEIGDFELAVHLSVLLHKVLFLTDRLLLHAAAVRLDDSVTVFVGDKGAGKTTLSLAVARAGGTILAEDHVLVRRHGGRFLVSGCDQRARLTEATERHFFPDSVDGPFRDLGGVRKRELRVADHFDSAPFRDFAPDRLCFIRVGERLSLERVSAARVLTSLLDATRKLQRFANADDQRRFLDFLAAFAASVPAFAAELSPDLDELERMIAFLRGASLEGTSGGRRGPTVGA